MKVELRPELGVQYRNGTQRARVITEDWVHQNLYCIACSSNKLQRERANARALDFRCVECNGLYELKGSSRTIAGRLPDGAYNAMVATMNVGRTPHLLAMHYDNVLWKVANLIAIPGFVLTPSTIHCRRPLAPTARRAGWVGCDILLSRMPADARVSIVKDGTPAPRKLVREQFAKLKPFSNLSLPQSGWTLDVLNVVRKLGKQEFSLAELQVHQAELQRLHPENMHVAEKVRQQLQVLRDMGLLTFVNNRGIYRLR
jgi:type II restriction enzyme